MLESDKSMSIPVHQHVIIECDHHSIHSLSSVDFSGLTENQLGPLLERFQLEKKMGTFADYQRASSYKFKRGSHSITDILNYLSHANGFILVSVTFSHHKNQFILRKEIFMQDL